MKSWMRNRVETESFILQATGVTDLNAFAAHHEQWLVSVEDHPQEAAHWWHWQKARTEPGEGWVSLRLDGTELMPLDGWTNIFFFWHSVLGALEEYLDCGRGVGYFSDEPAQFSLTRQGQIAICEIRGKRVAVDPESFTVALSSAASRFFGWVDSYAGGLDPSIVHRCTDLSAKIQSAITC